MRKIRVCVRCRINAYATPASKAFQVRPSLCRAVPEFVLKISSAEGASSARAKGAFIALRVVKGLTYGTEEWLWRKCATRRSVMEASKQAIKQSKKAWASREMKHVESASDTALGAGRYRVSRLLEESKPRPPFSNVAAGRLAGFAHFPSAF